MKYKTIDGIPVKRQKRNQLDTDGFVVTAQVMNGYLVLDIWIQEKQIYRYAIDIKTYEYALKKLEAGIWHKQKLCNITQSAKSYLGYSLSGHIRASKDDINCISNAFPTQQPGYIEGIALIEHVESLFGEAKRERAYYTKTERIDRLMSKVPPVQKDFKSWILAVLGGDTQYAFWDKKTKTYSCSSCGKVADMEKLDVTKDNKIRDKDIVKCPLCGAKLQVKKRSAAVERESMAMLLDNIDDSMSVARHFNIRVRWQYGSRASVAWEEAVRIFLYRNDPKWNCRIYYRQYPKNYSCTYIGLREPWWDTNPANRTIRNEFLYPSGIAECLKDTSYEEHTRFFIAAAGNHSQINYNKVMYQMSGCGERLEYLYKGRYYRLVKEMTERSWEYAYRLRTAPDIQWITGIDDMQMLHRLRDKNGGVRMMDWLAHVCETGERISDKALDFFESNKITPGDCRMHLCNMHPDQVMNYLIRMQQEQYPGMYCSSILGQWNDYLSMCQTLNKDINDALVYRPRELKRRHDEAVEEINRQRIIENMKSNPGKQKERADEMRHLYPGTEEVLKEIKEKYEYSTEEFIVLVPQRLIDIVAEGQALHHCVASTDRYFDRIRARETYVLFLRKAEDPETPYYTLEVEPDGTIRQHRSYFDEEPNIEYIRGFLREWQQVVKKRMNKKDRKYAEHSRRMREKNIDELREANNTRVLKGLEQDFLEAV